MRTLDATRTMHTVQLTHEERVRLYLTDVGPITPLQAWMELGIYRLSDVIHKLRKNHGIAIVNDSTDVHNRFGEPCRVAKYRIAAPAGEPQSTYCSEEE